MKIMEGLNYMISMKKKLEIKDITVFNKENTKLSFCTYRRASKLVLRNSAFWKDKNSIRLLVNNDDRKRLRSEIFEKSDRICFICNERIPQGISPTIDHVIPKVKGGEDTIDNMKCCCRRCNFNKANMLMKDYVIDMRNNPKNYPWITEDRLFYLIENYVD